MMNAVVSNDFQRVPMRVFKLMVLLLAVALFGAGGQVFAQQQESTAVGQEADAPDPQHEVAEDDEEPDCD